MEYNRNNVKISHIFWMFAVAFITLGAVLIIIGNQREKNLNHMQEITQEYIEGQDAITSLRNASDLLTEKSRSFVVTGDRDAARDYVKEVEVTKSREQAVEMLGGLAAGKEEKKLTEQLEKALDESNRLAQIEMYAMRLAGEGHGTDPGFLDAHFKSVDLSAADEALSSQEKISRASEMVFDKNYESLKTSILENVSETTEKLAKKTQEREAESFRVTNRYSRTQNILTVVLLAVIFIMMLLNSYLVIQPIRKSADLIKKNEFLPINGADEYAYLAETYNNILEKTRQQNQVLSYEATHDEITGIYNRKLFETKREEFAEKDTALLLLDVDLFKETNDQFGHHMGDKVLKTVASILQDCFRLEDYVCRIGGDEFAVIMVSMHPDLEYVVRDKIAMLRTRLNSAEDIPRTTVSIGVAFSQDAGDEDTFRKADQALYNTKENGRDGFTFYSELV